MKSYTERTRCPKCAYQGASSRYHHDTSGECIYRECQRCGYGWPQSCLDLPTAKKQEMDDDLLRKNVKELTPEEKKERRKLQCRVAMGKWLDKKAEGAGQR